MRYDHTLICHHSYLFQKIALSFIKRIYSFRFYKNIILNLVFTKKFYGRNRLVYFKQSNRHFAI